jgi:serine/threonine protein kinase
MMAQIYNRVAIKKLIDPDEDDFLKEANILRALAPKRHLHLLRLLATFQQTKSQEGLKWHFVFPCADANLRAYWDKTEPNPKFNERTVLWVLKQMAGITDGLSQVHIHEVVMPLSVKGVGGIRLKEGKTMSVEKGEQWYGRHGDIKPENILWFSKDPEHDDDRGMLKIADFGLGRFHGLDSRSKVPPETIAGTVTYEPPELKLGTPVSRAYDIWSLGCLFLEFITWLLMGAKAVHGFADARAEPYPSAPKMSDDSFFAIIRENGEATSAEVRKGVVKWVRRLHQHEHCTQLIHDLLDLVMEEMLVVDRDERTSATLLYKAFLNFKKKAEENNEYALLPTPWPADEQADPPQAGPSVLTLRRAPTVHFEDEDS